MWAVCKIGPVAEAAVPDLVAQLATRDAWVAAKALGSIGPGAKAAAPCLEDLLQRSKGYARLEAAEAIWKIDQNERLAVPALIALLDDDYGPIRVEAAQTLGEIGPPAAEALPVLKKMLEYKPRVERSLPKAGGNGVPRTVEMTDAGEFYPQIRRTVSAAIDHITRERRP